MITQYDVGDLVRVSGVVQDEDGTDIDPTTVMFKAKAPSGTVITYTYATDIALVKDSTGNYHVDVNANEAGTWYYRFYSTGTGQAAIEDHFRVKQTRF
jgi:uncharacterized protein YfaS (alpha-2-macroglobulin family)